MRIPKLACTGLLVAALTGCDNGVSLFNPPPDPGPGAPAEPPPIAVQQVFTQLAFNQPLLMLQAPGDDSVWFVVEKTGQVLSFPNDPDATLADVTVFADLTLLVDSSFGESGLLGMAFHPDFQANGEVFLSYTVSGSPLVSVVSRFFVDGNGVFDPFSVEDLLLIPQPFANHNGGNIVFGPDGFLYLGLGDGGSGGDPQENGQDTTTLLGSILRIDVDGVLPYAIPAENPFAGNTECFSGEGTLDCPEIFAWGFRNPWRFSFDRDTGELWVGDVGQNQFEEIDRVLISENFGWNDREGAHCFDPPAGCSLDNVDPITEYDHSLGISVTGGYVYRGTAIPELVGFYLFGDFGSGRIWAVPSDSAQGVEPDELLVTPLGISSFAESNAGELFVLDFGNGTIHQVVAD